MELRADGEKQSSTCEANQILNREIEEHRLFLERQFKHLSWAIGVLLAVALAAFYFFVHKTEADLRAELARQVDQSAVMLQIHEKLREELGRLVEINAEEVKKELRHDVTAEVGQIASGAVAETLASQGQASLNELVRAAARSEVRRFAASSLRASLDCQILFRGTQSGTLEIEYNYECPAGYDHVMNANIYSAGHPHQWQSLCCRVLVQ